MRREELYLTDIVEAADAIQRFLVGIDRDTFLRDDLLCSAVLQKLTIIGEAAARLPTGFREHHPEIEWADIIGFRNIAVHAYFAVARPIVWVTATEEVPELRRMIVSILISEYPDAELPNSAESN
jgi:uncharacterized protein with HEPN domain